MYCVGTFHKTESTLFMTLVSQFCHLSREYTYLYDLMSKIRIHFNVPFLGSPVWVRPFGPDRTRQCTIYGILKSTVYC